MDRADFLQKLDTAYAAFVDKQRRVNDEIRNLSTEDKTKNKTLKQKIKIIDHLVRLIVELSSLERSS